MPCAPHGPCNPSVSDQELVALPCQTKQRVIFFTTYGWIIDRVNHLHVSRRYFKCHTCFSLIWCLICTAYELLVKGPLFLKNKRLKIYTQTQPSNSLWCCTLCGKFLPKQTWEFLTLSANWEHLTWDSCRCQQKLGFVRENQDSHRPKEREYSWRRSTPRCRPSAGPSTTRTKQNEAVLCFSSENQEHMPWRFVLH